MYFNNKIQINSICNQIFAIFVYNATDKEAKVTTYARFCKNARMEKCGNIFNGDVVTNDHAICTHIPCAQKWNRK